VTHEPVHFAGNRLLAALPVRQRNRLLAQCQMVPLKFGDCLLEKSKRIRHVYFPVTGFVSLATITTHHKPIAITLIGNEGMVGAEVCLERRVAANMSVVQGAGMALRISVPAFVRQLAVCPVLRQSCSRYCYVLLEQMAQSIACNSFHEVPPRLSRWLLMAQDRADGANLQLTHALLAAMLGVRRSAVTIAAGQLQAIRLISYSRGDITVLSRGELEAMSCECYAVGVKAYNDGLLQPARIKLKSAP